MSRILIIEDEEDVSAPLEAWLAKEGFDVVVAADGETGLEQALTTFPDVIVLDLTLPGLPGEEICKQVREHDRPEINSIPIITISGKDTEADRIVGKVIGASAYLPKPFDTLDLIDGVRWFLHKKQRS